MHSSMLSVLSAIALLSSTTTAQMDMTVSNSSVPAECSDICSPIVKLASLCMPDSSSSSITSMESMSMSTSEPMTNSMTMSMTMPTTTPMSMGMVMMSVDMRSKVKKVKRADGTIVMMAMSDTEMAQLDCICTNKSFDVKAVMGLCASCLDMNAGGGDNSAVKNVNMLMTDCSFPSTSYAPSATSVLVGISVQGTAPGPSASSTGKAKAGTGRVEVTVGTLGLGMAMGGLGLIVGLMAGFL